MGGWLGSETNDRVSPFSNFAIEHPSNRMIREREKNKGYYEVPTLQHARIHPNKRHELRFSSID